MYARRKKYAKVCDPQKIMFFGLQKNLEISMKNITFFAFVVFETFRIFEKLQIFESSAESFVFFHVRRIAALGA